MNRAIELHDSEISRISISGRSALVRFSVVYIHESEHPGWDAGAVYSQGAELILHQAANVELPQEWPLVISHGEYVLDGVFQSNLLPLPFTHAREFSIRLDVMDGDDRFRVVELKGHGVELNLVGQPHSAGSFPGTSS